LPKSPPITRLPSVRIIMVRTWPSGPVEVVKVPSTVPLGVKRTKLVRGPLFTLVKLPPT